MANNLPHGKTSWFLSVANEVFQLFCLFFSSPWPHCLSWRIRCILISNKWARLYLLKFQLNICFDNDSSRACSNSGTRKILCSPTISIRVGVVTSEPFSLTEMICFRLYSSWITVDEIKSRSQEKHIKSFLKFSSLLSHERSLLFQCTLYHFQSSKLSLRAVLSLLFLKESY